MWFETPEVVRVDTVHSVLTLYDATRCPYCARVRIALAEKGLEHEVVAIDLDARPDWIFRKNPLGKVPVLEEHEGLALPESVVICEYLEERYPEPPLWPADPAERALGRLLVDGFDRRLGDDYYAVRRGGDARRPALEQRVAELDGLLEAQPFLTGRAYGLADIAFLPWIVRARSNLAIELEPYAQVSSWLERLASRPAVAAELSAVAAL